MNYDSNGLQQTISLAISTATVMMMSFGLVVLSRERIEADLSRIALRDPLTGTANRLAILSQLAEEMERARRQGIPLAIAMLDLDHFKAINDQHGHLVGDAILRHCASHLQRHLRSHDSIGRYGGEEFLLLLPGTDGAGAMELVRQLRLSLDQHPAHSAGKVIALSFSAGVYGVSQLDHDDLNAMLHQADTALYAAKHAGRSTQVLASAAPSAG